ncbi:MAG: tetratricopeptide repeat protein [Planctomycetes bacterium]|nr:tetratricopeptide repeat protein [Planctomycetota bacterium]
MNRLIIWCLITFLLLGLGIPDLSAQESSHDVIASLDHKNPKVRELAIELISQKKIKTAVGSLIETLEDENEEIRVSAHRVLQQLTRKDFPLDYTAWSDWWNKEGAGNKEFAEKIFTASDLTKIRERIYFAMGVIIALLALLLLFILVFSFMGGSKIKEMKEVLKRADKYISDAEEVTKKSDQVIEELEVRRSEMLGFFSKLKNENESEIERFCDLLQQNVEHRMREVTMNLREKAETELKQTAEQIRTDIVREVKRIFAEQKGKFLNEVEAQMLFVEGSFYLANNKHEDALKIYEKVLTLKPDHHMALINRGAALRNLKRYKESIESCEKALQASSDNPAALYQLAATYALMKNKDKMIDGLTRAFQGETELKDEALNDQAFKSYWHDRAFKNLAES